LLAVFIVLQAINGIWAQQVVFTSEKVVISLDSVFVRVSADYEFTNFSGDSLTTAILYPVPKSPVGLSFDTLLILDPVHQGKYVSYQLINDTAALFRITLPPGRATNCRIFYRQQHYGHSARYIVTTTRAQKQPLKRAEFELIVPVSLKIVKFSFEPSSESRFDDCIIYRWNFTGFYPDRDMDFEFE